ncbi:MAG TPA: ATP-binding cassette domain-containing protein [Gaiellaceae bacterium]|nr:ATP-binding cassette domain-containing protein [Gaiellaceae bacterium]
MPESHSAPLVSVRALSKTYRTPAGGIEALHSLDATFVLGEIAAVVGASGSGKSTLLKALAGLDRPSSGSLVVAGSDLAGASPGELRRHRRSIVTYVSQKPADNFIPYLRLTEQVDGAGGEAETLFGEFGLGHRLGSRPAELSGGEQARAAFALALLRATPLVVSDEPTAELDAGATAPLLEAIRAHAGEGLAFVIATHDDDVIAIADRVLRLDRGRVIDPDGGPKPVGRSRPTSSAPVEPLVSVSGLSKSFGRGSGRIVAVREASLELYRGDLGALVGRSGSGKTTILTLLAGLHEPDAGSIRYALSAPAPAALPWTELAFLPQRFGLLPELSVRENVEYPARLAGRLEKRRASIDSLIERLGLTEHAARPPQETSIGQQQRTALARALALSPAVLLADEPTSHQDAGWRDGVWQVLVEAAESGTACLIATHEPEIAQYATRVWEVSEGAVSAG